MRPSKEFVKSIFENDRHLLQADNLRRRMGYEESTFSGPLSVDFTLSDTCQHKCHFCVDGRNEVVGPIMKADDAKRMLRQLRDAGVRSVNFEGGGEPLIGPFAEACEYAHSIGMSCGLITNGGLLGLEKNMSTALMCCKYVRVSLDAGTGYTHEKRHGVASGANNGWDDVIYNVARLVQQRDRLEHDFPVVGIGFLISDDSAYELNVAYLKAMNLGVDYIAFRPMHDGKSFFKYDHDNELHRISRSNLLKLAEEMSNEPTAPYLSLDWGSEDFVSTKKCFAPQVKIAVGADGRVYTCCNKRYVDDFSFGRMTDKTSFSDIWNGEARKQKTKWLTNVMQDMNRHCNSCNSEGLNRAMTTLEDGNPHWMFLA